MVRGGRGPGGSRGAGDWILAMPDPPPAKLHGHPARGRGEDTGETPVPPGETPVPSGGECAPAYAELHCLSNFSFLRGASHPEELVEQAAELGYAALAITDRNSLAGVVRAHVAAREWNESRPERPIRLILGAEITPVDGPAVVLLVPDRAAYGRLCRLITRGRLRCRKGECEIRVDDLAEFAGGMIAIVDADADAQRGAEEDSSGDPRFGSAASGAVQRYRAIFGDDLYLAATLRYDVPDELRLAELAGLSRRLAVPLVATGAVLYHVPERRYLQDVLTCIREKCTLARAGSRLEPNAERHLRCLEEIERRYACSGDGRLRRVGREALQRTVQIAARCTFSLDELRYEYPHELVPAGRTAMDYLEELTWRGAAERYGAVQSEARAGSKPPPAGDGSAVSLPGVVRELLAAELALIRELRYEHYFLTVWDLCRFARSRGILCQGRGSAANSAVCYCLGITAVDPARHDLLFERFISRERNEPPDIDVDFEHERREEVFQYIYEKYGRERAGITAEVISYRPRSAIRDVGKALGLSLDSLDALAKGVDWFDVWAGQGGESCAGQTAAGGGAAEVSAAEESTARVGAGEDASCARQEREDPSWRVGSGSRATALRKLPAEPSAMRALRGAGLDPSDRTVRMLVKLVRQILGFPRHLSQHVGGFVITETPLCEIVPIENGAMPRRTFIEWDKDDIDAVGLLKVDCLALGMLTALQKCFALLKGLRDSGIEGLRGRPGLPYDQERDPRSRRLPALTGDGHGREDDVSRPDRVAQEHRSDQAKLRDDGRDAGDRAVRADSADAAGGGLDRQQHRRGERAASPQRLYSLSDDRARLAGGGGNTDRHRTGAGVSCARAGAVRADGGDFENASGADHEAAGEADQERAVADSKQERLCEGVLREPPQSLNPLVPYSLLDIPPEDPRVYDTICAADTVGVFQIESRAQMSMLPRLRPRNFYDLVIEVAIVRPGPIQGGMVHPYLRRRHGLDPVEYPSPDVERVLAKTLGVPIFQEQVMRLAVVAAGFTPGEADQLRRAMAAWRRSGQIEKFKLKLVRGMLERGYSKQFAEQIYRQIRGFGEYGFPESHAASFALLVYASAWLKCYHPAAFCGAMLNSQPLGFYTPGQLVRDAREHGVEVRPVDVNRSDWDCTLEAGGSAGPALRLGFRVIRGLSEEKVRGVVAARCESGGIRSLRQLARQSDVSRETLLRLAAADAFGSLGLGRRRALWEILALERDELRWGGRAGAGPAGRAGRATGWLFAELEPDEPAVELPAMPLEETVFEDYDAVGFSLNAHPISLVRAELDEVGRGGEGSARRRDAGASGPSAGAGPSENAPGKSADRGVGELRVKVAPRAASRYASKGGRRQAAGAEKLPAGVLRCGELRTTRHGRRVAVAGLVTCRQRPGTAKGIVFMTLEDETGMANLIIRPEVWERDREVARGRIAVVAEGVVERQGEVVHVMVRRVHDLGAVLAARAVPQGLKHASRDFH